MLIPGAIEQPALFRVTGTEFPPIEHFEHRISPNIESMNRTAKQGPPLLILLHLTCLFWAGTRMATASDGTATQRIPAVELFRPGPLRSITLELSDESLQQLRKDNRRHVRATFREGETVLRDVGVHLKGAAGSFRGLEDKPAWTVNFDKFVPGQRWLGLEKIHLNNSVQDGSYLCENLCGEIFRRAGVPAARACNVRVTFNGRDLGVYVLKEGFDKTFLKQYFANARGNLYDGGFCRDIDQPLEKVSGNEARDQPEIRALMLAAYEGDPAKRFQKLAQRLDLDRFITYCALEVMLWDWDGYVMKPNNYKLYWDPSTDKITFFPHGMDQMFWEPQGAINPGFNGLVARGLIETPEGSRLYRQRMAELTTNLFQLSWMTNYLLSYAGPVRAALASRSQSAARHYDGEVARILELVSGRAAFLNKKFSAPNPALAFKDGVMSLKHWEVQRDASDTRLDQITDADGRMTCHILATDDTVASWRCRLQLPPGRYRFEGLARTREVLGRRDATGEGAGLRVSGMERHRHGQLTGTTPWTPLACDFTVSHDDESVTLICELRALKGEAWFDLNSLRLVQVK